MERETLICPLCGAPHREAIPANAVQVKCKYCGGTILVPVSVGGAVQRCPNHPDVLAVGLCNDCGGSFCGSCLSIYNVEHGTLHLCPTCFRVRETDNATYGIIFGVLVFFVGFFFIALAPSSQDAFVAGVFFIGVVALPFIAWGIYKSTRLLGGVTVKERNEAIQRETELRKSFGDKASVSELYSRLLNAMIRNYDPRIAYELIERRISYFQSAGKTRSEAIRELAEEQGYL